MVWKSPLPGWSQILDNTFVDMASAGLPPVFFRADDIGAPSKAFEALSRLFRSHGTPLAMAVIPAYLSEARQEKLFKAAPMDEELWGWHQHGWRHINRQKNGERSEFGSERSPERQREDIIQGMVKMERVFGKNFVRVFAPPWNHLSASTLKILQQLDFKGFSATDPFQPAARCRYGMQYLPVRLDLHNRQGKDATADFAMLMDQLSGLSKAKGPTGIMISHQRMTSFAFQFLDRMLYNLKHVVKAQFCNFRKMLNGSDEKQAGARLR
jgi:peptidoglycan/xylan/chitin deacetylase (PgdA/CDA1 family)